MYNPTTDPNEVAIKQVLDKCGLLGNKAGPIPLLYQVDISVKAVVFDVGLPQMDGKTSFPCPIPAGLSMDKITQLVNQFKTPPGS